MVYVDDVVILGHYPDKLFAKIQEHVLLRHTGEFKEGETAGYFDGCLPIEVMA